VQVEVADVDELRAELIGSPGDGASQLLLADVTCELDDLTRLDVGAERDQEVSEPLQPRARAQACLVERRAGDQATPA
jgi:hypothetical protein